MTTWQLIKKLMNGASFKWRHFFVWTIAIVVCGTIFGIWRSQSVTHAAFEFSNQPNYDFIEQANLDIVIKPNGKVVANGKDISSKLKIFKDFDEISILAIDSPGTFIGKFQAVMHLPSDIQSDQVKQVMYAVHGVGSYSSQMVDSRTLLYSAENISSQASVTVVADLPKNIIHPPFLKVLFFNLAQLPIKSYLILAIALPSMTFVFLGFMIFRRRQDQIFYLSNKITLQPPVYISPAIVGTLMDGRVGPREIAATLVDLAARGYLFITRHPNGDFSFGKRKTLSLEKLPELKNFEQVLLTKIFEPTQYKSTNEDVEMRVGRHIFSRKMAEVYLDIYNETMRLGYFIKNPVQVHLFWRYMGIVSFFLGLLGFIFTAAYWMDPKYTLFFWVGQMAAATVIIWLSGLMPARSVTGTATLRQWLQFRQYLNLPAPVEGGAGQMEKFSQYLPYAIVFGVEVDWAKRFLSTTFVKPDWYESDDPALSVEIFAGELFPLIAYVGSILDKSHEPTVE